MPRMKRKHLMTACGAAWMAATALAQPADVVAPASAKVARPNVLFLIADDLNVDLGCYGHKIVQSPHIDRLAATAMRFDRAYCQFPLCNPSRASLLAGLRPRSMGVLDNRTPIRAKVGRIDFLPEHFRKAGYRTLAVGKVAHDAFADEIEWDSAVIDAKTPNLRFKKTEAGDDTETDGRRGRRRAAPLRWNALQLGDEFEPDGYNTRYAVKQLEALTGGPFFMAVGFNRPHLPFRAPKAYFNRYDLNQIQLPARDVDKADVGGATSRGAASQPAASAPADAPLSDADLREAIRAYYACVSYVDAQIGLLLDALDRLKLADNTIVVLCSDHGFSLGEYAGQWRKGSLHESVARVPLLIRAPGRRPGVCARLVELVDLYPTLSDLCGLPVAAALEGSSLAPLLDDPQRPWKRAAFTTLKRQRDGVEAEGVCSERYRFTRWTADGRCELFDLQADPAERRNLADDAASEPLREHRSLLEAGWQAARPAAEQPQSAR